MTVTYTAPDEGALSLFERTLGPANVKTRLNVALLFNMNDALMERDKLDPADALPITALSDIQTDVSQLDPAIPTLIETAVSPIPEPYTVTDMLPVTGGNNTVIEDTTMRSVLIAEVKLPTLPDCEIATGTKTALIAWDLTATHESLIHKCAA